MLFFYENFVANGRNEKVERGRPRPRVISMGNIYSWVCEGEDAFAPLSCANLLMAYAMGGAQLPYGLVGK